MAHRDDLSASTSGVFWRSPHARAATEAIARHNARIGGRVQRAAQYIFLGIVVGPIACLVLRVLFRVRVEGREHIAALERGGIWVLQHFFEWDPIFAYVLGAWARSLTCPALMAHFLAGSFWTKSRPRRALSWTLGILGLVRGSGADQPAFRRAEGLLASGRPLTIGVCPTGPIGRQTRYEIRPGVAELALRLPSTPLIPVAIVGLREACLRDVLLLRRPSITITFGEAFRAIDVAGTSHPDARRAIAKRIERSWDEARLACARSDASISDPRQGQHTPPAVTA